MISKVLACIIAIALGLYGAWWVSAAAHFFYVENAKSFDELSTAMAVWFLVAATVLCPTLCWGLLKALKHFGGKGKAS